MWNINIYSQPSFRVAGKLKKPCVIQIPTNKISK